MRGSEGPSWVFWTKNGNRNHGNIFVGPHSGTNLSDLAKIVPGTFMVILIPLVKKTQFGIKKAFVLNLYQNLLKV